MPIELHPVNRFPFPTTFDDTVTFRAAASYAGAVTLTSTLSVTGAATLSSTLAVTGAATLSSTLAVTGAATLSSTLSVGSNVKVRGPSPWVSLAHSSIGGVGDDATDNAAALSTWLTILPGTGGRLAIDAGSFRVTTGASPLAMEAVPFIMAGEGNVSKLIDARNAGASIAFLKLSGAGANSHHGITLRDFWLYGLPTAGAALQIGDSADANQTNHVDVSGVYISGSQDGANPIGYTNVGAPNGFTTGLKFDTALKCTTDKVYIEHIIGSAFVVTGVSSKQANQNSYRAMRFRQSGSNGAPAVDVNNGCVNTFETCLWESNYGPALRFQSIGFGHMLINPWFENNNQTNNPGGVGGCYHVLVKDQTVFNWLGGTIIGRYDSGAEDFIQITGSSAARIQCARIEPWSANQHQDSRHIYVDSTCRKTIIEGNHFYVSGRLEDDSADGEWRHNMWTSESLAAFGSKPGFGFRRINMSPRAGRPHTALVNQFVDSDNLNLAGSSRWTAVDASVTSGVGNALDPVSNTQSWIWTFASSPGKRTGGGTAYIESTNSYTIANNEQLLVMMDLTSDLATADSDPVVANRIGGGYLEIIDTTDSRIFAGQSVRFPVINTYYRVGTLSARNTSGGSRTVKIRFYPDYTYTTTVNIRANRIDVIASANLEALAEVINENLHIPTTQTATASLPTQTAYTPRGHIVQLTTQGHTIGVRSIFVAYTVTRLDELILASASGGAYSVTLPTASSHPGMRVTIKKTDSSVNAVTVTRSGSNTIDGATTYALTSQYQSVTLVSDGVSAWSVAASYL